MDKSLSKLNRAVTILYCGIVGLLLIMTSNSCDKSEDSSKVTGTVAVQGASGDSVVVRLYERPDTGDDVSVWSVPERHSSVGFTYQAQNIFDHRITLPLAADTTDAGGHFEFNDLNPGNYIVVADGQTPNFGNTHYKENYGWSTPREVRVDGSEADVGVLNLYPDTVLSITNIGSPVTVPAGGHWVLQGNMFIGSGGSLTVEPGAVIRIGRNIGIRVTSGGQFICNGTSDNFVVVTTDDIINQDPEEWATIRFSEGALPPQISYTKFEYAQTAIETSTQGGTIEYCFFHRLNEAFRSSVVPPVFNRNVIRKAGLGVHCGNATGVDISNNVFQTCDPFSVTLDIISDGRIYNNWFRDGGGSDSSSSGERGVMRLEWMSDFEISQNSIETSWFALTVGSGVDTTVNIHHNTFNRVHKALFIGVTNDRLRYSNPVFRYNCLTSIDEFFAHIANCQINTREVKAEYNCWDGIMNTSVLQSNFMWDCVRQPSDPVPCPCFSLNPVLSNCADVESLTGTPAGVSGG